MFLLGFGQRLAAGTSLAAIVPTSLVGVISYAVNGTVDWVAAILLAAGAIGGAQLGSYLLAKLPKKALQWGFIGFLLVVVVSLFLIVPSRTAEIDLHVGSIIGLILLGFLTGVLSGLLGIGGGVVVVPMLILLFGASDLIAKGTLVAHDGADRDLRHHRQRPAWQRRPPRRGDHRGRGVHDDRARRHRRVGRPAVRRQPALRGVPRGHRDPHGVPGAEALLITPIVDPAPRPPRRASG